MSASILPRALLARMNTWKSRDPETGRHHRHGHLIELGECDWRCLICGHWFDAATDADLFWCGDPCEHPADCIEARP